MNAVAIKSRAALTATAVFAVFNLAATTAAAAYTVTYSYDKAGRLTKASYGGNSGFSYTYDATGNIVKIGKRFPWPMFLPAINAGEAGSTIPRVPLVYRDETALSVLEKN
jgi:uncharacterized membrane protein